jgi:hypothetical protein
MDRFRKVIWLIRAGTVSPAIHSREGDTGDVMATVERSGVAAWLPRIKAGQLAAQLHCSVLAMTPASFATSPETGV